MDGGEILADYACKCLNIRLSAAKTGHTSNHLTTARDYIPVYVGEEGIQVIHRQLTLKSRSAAVPVDLARRRNGERLQYTSISCLVCDSEAYRIALEIAQESELKEGPVIPTDDWVECEILQSKTGWVDVYVGPQGCVTKDEIARMIASEHYSPHFSIAVLGEGNVPSITNPTKFSIPPEHTFLPRLSTFILPPPYTPSHPIYLHLAKVARSLSDNIRTEAEASVAKYAQEQLSRVEEMENHLKVQLEQLWENARDSLRKAEHTRDAASPNSARRMSSPSRGSAISSSLPHVASVVREFRPSTYHVHRSEVRPRVAATSALSASLATTAAHFPRSLHERSIAQSERHDQQNLSSESLSPPPYASNPSSPGTDSVKSSDSTPGLGIPRSLARNMNAEQDTSVTYRYYVIEEQERARARAKALDASNARRQDDEVATNTTGQAEATPVATDQSKAVEQHEGPGKQQPKSTTEGSTPVSTTQKTPDKKSRKVTFDVNPDVVTIKREINAEKEGLNNSTSEDDMIFDIDGSDESETENTDIEPQAHSKTSEKTGFVNTISRVRKESPERAHKNKSMAGLPSSFVALRPSSLPAPSNVRPPLRTPILQHSKEQTLSPRRSAKARSSRMARVSEDEEKPLKQYERELRKLVAADVPSHRGAWSRAEVWKAFGTKGKGRSRLGSTSTTLEDNESDTEGDNETDHSNISHSYDGTANWRDYHPSNLSSSLPVTMGPIRKLKSSMGKSSSGAPALAMLEEANEEEPSHGIEPEKVRKQAHTERDRVRSLDPGLLDFATDDDDVKEQVDTTSSSRGKQYALKIIAARNAVPEEGMWRSLA